MKGSYDTPVLEIILLDAGDIVTLSNSGNNYGGENGGVLQP